MSAPETTSAEILGLVERQAVYRCYAEDGTLLYIGTTGHLGRRLAEHAQKTWFLASTKITLEWYPGEDAALKAERKAIEVEGPKINVTHNRAVTVQLARLGVKQARPVTFLSASPRPDGAVTIREALATGFLPGYANSGAVRTAKYRNPEGFPPVLGRRGTERFYDAAGLKEWALATKNRNAQMGGVRVDDDA